MVDFGTPEERDDALLIALACKKLNEVIERAPFFVRVIDDHAGNPDVSSQMRIEVMERRTMILPSSRTPQESGRE